MVASDICSLISYRLARPAATRSGSHRDSLASSLARRPTARLARRLNGLSWLANRGQLCTSDSSGCKPTRPGPPNRHSLSFLRFLPDVQRWLNPQQARPEQGSEQWSSRRGGNDSGRILCFLLSAGVHFSRCLIIIISSANYHYAVQRSLPSLASRPSASPFALSLSLVFTFTFTLALTLPSLASHQPNKLSRFNCIYYRTSLKSY